MDSEVVEEEEGHVLFPRSVLRTKKQLSRRPMKLSLSPYRITISLREIRGRPHNPSFIIANTLG